MHSIGKLVMARLPIAIQGLGPITQLDHQNVSYTIDAPGYHYTSPWRPAELQDNTLSLLLPQEALDIAGNSDVRMHVSYVAQLLQPGTPQTVVVADRFSIPGNGTSPPINVF